jgi:hypothetical protein
MTSYLKKIVFIKFLLMIALEAFAPSGLSLVIINISPDEPFKPLIHAIGMVETKHDTVAYNPVEEAVGYFQIRPIRVEDYNMRTGSNYLMKDMFDYKVSEKVFLYYASQLGPYEGPYDFERIARNWNGSGKSTIQYWKQVKKFL